jgi:hypothetical protein
MLDPDSDLLRPVPDPQRWLPVPELIPVLLLFLQCTVPTLQLLLVSLETCCFSRSRIHERTISLRFLGIIYRVLRLEVSVYNVYFANRFQPTSTQGWSNPLVDVTVISKEENS